MKKTIDIQKKVEKLWAKIEKAETLNMKDTIRQENADKAIAKKLEAKAKRAERMSKRVENVKNMVAKIRELIKDENEEIHEDVEALVGTLDSSIIDTDTAETVEAEIVEDDSWINWDAVENEIVEEFEVTANLADEEIDIQENDIIIIATNDSGFQVTDDNYWLSVIYHGIDAGTLVGSDAKKVGIHLEKDRVEATVESIEGKKLIINVRIMKHHLDEDIIRIGDTENVIEHIVYPVYYFDENDKRVQIGTLVEQILRGYDMEIQDESVLSYSDMDYNKFYQNVYYSDEGKILNYPHIKQPYVSYRPVPQKQEDGVEKIAPVLSALGYKFSDNRTKPFTLLPDTNNPLVAYVM